MRGIAAFVTLVALSTAVAAEPQIGSRIGDRDQKRQIGDERTAAEIAHQFAGCILATRGSAGVELLNARSQAEADKLSARMTGEVECIPNITRNDTVEGVEVSYPPEIMRGDIAEELLKRHRDDVARLQPLPLQRIYSRPWFAFTGRNVSVDEMAACVADTNPAGVMALVDSAPFSDSEGAAFGKLVAYMGPCLRAGTKVDAKREPLRAALAEALYQRMANPAESLAQATQNGSGGTQTATNH